LSVAWWCFLLEGKPSGGVHELFAVVGSSISLVLDSDADALLLVLTGVLVELLVAALRSDIELEGVEDLVEGLNVGDHGELLGVLEGAVRTNVSTVRNVGVRRAVVLAVNAKGVELILLHDVVDVDLLFI
jgi:hypothetical protein